MECARKWTEYASRQRVYVEKEQEQLAMATVEKLCELLSLRPHPEGGFFSETFRDEAVCLKNNALPPRFKVDRPVSTAIYYLLPTGCVSRLHRIPSSEVWHFYAGDPLTVFEIDQDGKVKQTVLGSDIAAGQKLQYAVQPMVWFGAYPTKDVQSISENGSSLVKARSRDPEHHYSLVGCTVSPGFQYEDFEMAKREDLISWYPNTRAAIEYLTPEH